MQSLEPQGTSALPEPLWISIYEAHELDELLSDPGFPSAVELMYNVHASSFYSIGLLQTLQPHCIIAADPLLLGNVKAALQA